MYKSEDVKRAYFANRYRNNKDNYKRRQTEYWINYAKKQLNREFVTEQDVKDCKNEYYRTYRHKNAEKTKKNTENFWKNQAAKLDMESE